MADIQQAYTSATTGTGGINSLATSASLINGYEWFVIDNSSALELDYGVFGTVMVGTTPTINTSILIYLVASYDGTTWPAPFDGTPGAITTIPTAGNAAGYLKLAASLQVDATTSDRAYAFSFNVAQFFGGVCPRKVAVFCTHNTGVNLNSTAGNQTYGYVGEFATAS